MYSKNKISFRWIRSDNICSTCHVHLQTKFHLNILCCRNKVQYNFCFLSLKRWYIFLGSIYMLLSLTLRYLFQILEDHQNKSIFLWYIYCFYLNIFFFLIFWIRGRLHVFYKSCYFFEVKIIISLQFQAC